MFTIAGKVALITGGAMGIGAGIAKELLQAELRAVAILDINEEVGFRLVDSLNKEFGDGRAIFVKGDVSDRKQFDDLLKHTVEVFGNLDIVVNNAVTGGEKNWEKSIGVNLIGTISGTILAFEDYLPKYKTDEEAVIINISSVAGLWSFPPFPIYSAAKSAIIGLTRALGYEAHYQRTKIKVIALCPGATDTASWQADASQFLGLPYFNLYECFVKNLTVPQEISNVSQAVLEVIQNAASGSVWIVERNQKPHEFKFTTKDYLKG